jgi:RES domain-containing protein
MSGLGVRDLQLLDLVDAEARTPFSGTVWRVVREGVDPTQGRPVSGRWDPGLFDVLYTSMEKEGAIAEIHYHLSLQPVFPSKTRSVVHELRVSADATLVIPDLAALTRLGVAADVFQSRNYARMQQIGDAAFFLGFDALIAPSARYACQNMVLFTERYDPGEITAVNRDVIDWDTRRGSRH